MDGISFQQGSFAVEPGNDFHCRVGRRGAEEHHGEQDGKIGDHHLGNVDKGLVIRAAAAQKKESGVWRNSIMWRAATERSAMKRALAIGAVVVVGWAVVVVGVVVVVVRTAGAHSSFATLGVKLWVAN